MNLRGGPERGGACAPHGYATGCMLMLHEATLQPLMPRHDVFKHSTTVNNLPSRKYLFRFILCEESKFTEKNLLRNQNIFQVFLVLFLEYSGYFKFCRISPGGRIIQGRGPHARPVCLRPRSRRLQIHTSVTVA